MNSIHEGVASKNHCLQEGQVMEKDYNTDIIEVINLHTQFISQNGKNKQEIKKERVRCW